MHPTRPLLFSFPGLFPCLAALAGLVLGGCAASELSTAAPDGGDAPCPLGRTGYAIYEVDLPVGSGPAQRLGFDLDGDPRGQPDNAGGRALTSLVAAWPDAEPALYREIEAALESGWVGWVVVVDSCFNGGGGGYVRVGLQRAELSAAGYRLVDEVAPAIGWRRGDRVVAEGGAGRAPVSLFMDVDGLEPGVGWSRGDGLRVELLHTTPADLEGRIGLGLGDEFGPIARRVLAGFYTARLIDGTSGFAISLDVDRDGVVSPNEIAANPVLANLLADDVDLMAAPSGEPVLAPRQDGVLDRYSLGLGIHATEITLLVD